MNEIYILLYTLLTICLILCGISIKLTWTLLKTGLCQEGNPIIKRIIHKKGLIIFLNLFTFFLVYFPITILLFSNYNGNGLFWVFIAIIGLFLLCIVDFIHDLNGFIQFNKIRELKL